MIAFGRPAGRSSELARQAAAAITLADRYTDAFARAQRRKQPKAAAEIQQSLLPPRIARVTGGEVAGNVLPSYEVAGDWFDVVENSDGIWITLADGLGARPGAAASSAVALGALRASRRSGGRHREALVIMHQTLSELPGPQRRDTRGRDALGPRHLGLVSPTAATCADSDPARTASPSLEVPPGKGPRRAIEPEAGRARHHAQPGDRLVMVSDGVAPEATARPASAFRVNRRRPALRARERRGHGQKGSHRRSRVL